MLLNGLIIEWVCSEIVQFCDLDIRDKLLLNDSLHPNQNAYTFQENPLSLLFIRLDIEGAFDRVSIITYTIIPALVSRDPSLSSGSP